MKRVRQKKSAGSNLAPKPYSGILATPIWLQELPLPKVACADWTKENLDALRLHLDVEEKKIFGEAFAALYAHYNIEISDPNAERLLLNALIAAHVPAFQLHAAIDEMQSFRSTDRGQPTRLGPVETILFLSDVEKAKTQARKSGEKVSNRKVAARLSTMERYKKLGLNPEAIRKLIAQLESAARDLKAGRATEFQLNFLFRVVPFLAKADKP